jgi:hypothetical protein
MAGPTTRISASQAGAFARPENFMSTTATIATPHAAAPAHAPPEFERTGQQHLLGELLRRRLDGSVAHYPKALWRAEVAQGRTESGYWTWVAGRAQSDSRLEKLLELSSPDAAVAARERERTA